MFYKNLFKSNEPNDFQEIDIIYNQCNEMLNFPLSVTLVTLSLNYYIVIMGAQSGMGLTAIYNRQRGFELQFIIWRKYLLNV